MRGAGQRSPEAPSLVLRLALHNPAHQSYIHSFVAIHLWCFSLLQVPEFQCKPGVMCYTTTSNR